MKSRLYILLILFRCVLLFIFLLIYASICFLFLYKWDTRCGCTITRSTFMYWIVQFRIKTIINIGFWCAVTHYENARIQLY